MGRSCVDGTVQYYGRPGNLYLHLEQARVATAQAGRRRLPRWSR